MKTGTGFAIDVGMRKQWSYHQQHRRVSVSASARLHLGFLDISGALGRRFGGLGLSIDAFRTTLQMWTAPTITASGPSADRAAGYARRMLDLLGIDAGVQIRIDEAIPDHAGLGSGTQMALAVGYAIHRLFGLSSNTAQVARQMERGRRSGIGIGGFDHGGFMVDSGIGECEGPPPLTVQMPYPDSWRVLLVMDSSGQGLHGGQEVQAFRNLPPFPAEHAARLCHLTLMQILPGIREQQMDPVASGIAELQRCVGDHFAPAQGGRYTSTAVADLLNWVESKGYAGVGQSSWGPTGFVLLPDHASAVQLRAQARQRVGELSPLRFEITAACNEGSRVSVETDRQAVKETR
ncbi:MAG: GHMP kinase [Sedimenticola sp.]|nr:GHMP kinase [Sedimenticola sp.]